MADVHGRLQHLPSGPDHPLTPTSDHPTITSTAIMNSSLADQLQLVEIHDLLDRLFIRNRNQHRRNHWFKSLVQFRKQLGLLVSEIEMIGNKKGHRKADVAARIEARLRYWDEGCVHQWYLHFTQLVAVGPFAVLGLVLMACTARVCRISGITAVYEEMASEDMRVALHLLDEGEVEYRIGDLMGVGGDDEEDVGEVIARE